MTTFGKVRSLLAGDPAPPDTVQQYAKEARSVDDLQVGLFEKSDGSQWIRNPDGTETQVTGGGGGGLGATGFEILTFNFSPFPGGGGQNAASWSKSGGDDLADLTDPTQPIFPRAFYAMTLSLAAAATAGKVLNAFFNGVWTFGFYLPLDAPYPGSDANQLWDFTAPQPGAAAFPLLLQTSSTENVGYAGGFLYVTQLSGEVKDSYFGD